MKNLISLVIQTIVSFFTGSNKYFTGLIPDTRPPEEKAKDYLHEERVMASVPVDPFSFSKITDSKYPYLNQFGTSSCVPHAISMAAAIERENDTGIFVSPAPIFVYRMRSNYPGEGTYPPEAFSIIANLGVPQAPSLMTPATEAQANAVSITPQLINEAAPFKGKSYFTFGIPNDIDAIARVAALGHAVPICLYATVQEWAQEYPQLIYPDMRQADPRAVVQHEIFVLPNSGFMENGKKYLTIQDSAWFGNLKIRHVSEDFIKARVYAAGYWDTVATVGGGTRPHYKFSQILNVGDNNAEVKQVQLLLISENLLASDCSTGYFGGQTLAAVHNFQAKYASEILDPRGLSAPTDIWGGGCIAKANALCV